MQILFKTIYVKCKNASLNIQSKWEKEVHMGVVIKDYKLEFYLLLQKILNYRTFNINL